MLADFWQNYSTLTFYAKSPVSGNLSYGIDHGTISDITGNFTNTTPRISGTLSVGQTLDLKAQNIQYNMGLSCSRTASSGSFSWFVIKLE